MNDPGEDLAEINVVFQTSEGETAPPELQGFTLAPRSRVTFKVNDYVSSFNVSTEVTASGNVVCERSMYGGNRTWAHGSIGYAP